MYAPSRRLADRHGGHTAHRPTPEDQPTLVHRHRVRFARAADGAGTVEVITRRDRASEGAGDYPSGASVWAPEALPAPNVGPGLRG